MGLILSHKEGAVKRNTKKLTALALTISFALNKMLLLGTYGANQNFYSGNCAITVIRTDAELIINTGVKLCNNYSGGEGGAIRAEAGSTLTINGGVFTGNNAIDKCIYYLLY